jgi:hypothetical protein
MIHEHYTMFVKHIRPFHVLVKSPLPNFLVRAESLVNLSAHTQKGIQIMLIHVPFIYSAQVIYPRKRKAVEVAIKDTIEVEIREITQPFPVAFKVENKELHWIDGQLWQLAYEDVHGQPKRTVNIDEVVANTKDCSEYPWSCSGVTAPFHNFWHRGNYEPNYDSYRHKWLNDESICTRDAVQCREWVSDNRLKVAQQAQDIASGYVVYNGLMYRRAAEPFYYAITFGLSNNHGGTSLSIGSGSADNMDPSSCFSSLEYELAVQATSQIALNRGDTESIKHITSGYQKIEVLLPEAVQLRFPAFATRYTGKFLNPLLLEVTLAAIRAKGTFNPDEIMFIFEETLTLTQAHVLWAFLGWVHLNNKPFNRTNAADVLADFYEVTDLETRSYIEGKEIEFDESRFTLTKTEAPTKAK